jgi:lysophospholipase L1-like esterase
MAAPQGAARLGRGRRLLFGTIVLLLGFALTIVLDRALGLIHRPPPGAKAPLGLLFPPRTTTRSVTTEFDYTASVNALGFRDRDFPVAKGPAYRILAIGDSYTYGWGVADDEPWPKVLERDLRRLEPRVEVANLGAPGASPTQYAETAERAVPLLRPDLVILCIVQGNDFGQMWWETQTVSDRLAMLGGPRDFARLARAKLERTLGAVLGRLYPNTMRVVRDRAARRAAASPAVAARSDTISIGEAQRTEALAIEASFNAEQHARYEKLDPEVKELFRNGKLNPASIYYGVKMPKYYVLSEPDELNTRHGRAAVDRMAEDFARVRAVASRYGAKAIIVSGPFGPYVNERLCRAAARMGNVCEPSLLTTTAPDDVVRLAATKAGLPFFAVTEEFRRTAVREPLFFELDGHLNKAGQQRYGDLLAPIVAGVIGLPASAAPTANVTD